MSYVALDEDAPGTVLGYFTQAWQARLARRFQEVCPRLPPYDLPLSVLASLAVDRRLHAGVWDMRWFLKRSVSACESPMKSAAAALLQMPIGIGSVGIHDTGLCT